LKNRRAYLNAQKDSIHRDIRDFDKLVAEEMQMKNRKYVIN